jgi:hypothetical protein
VAALAGAGAAAHTLVTYHLLALLDMMFEDVTIFLPVTTRFANDEEYVICSGFIASAVTNDIKLLFRNCLSTIESKGGDYFVTSLINLLPENPITAELNAFTDTLIKHSKDLSRFTTYYINKTIRNAEIQVHPVFEDNKFMLRKIEFAIGFVSNFSIRPELGIFRIRERLFEKDETSKLALELAAENNSHVNLSTNDTDEAKSISFQPG